MKKQDTLETCCAVCGGQLEQKSKDFFQCTYCGRGYYMSDLRIRRIQLRLSVKNMILLLAAVVMTVTTIAVIGYQFYINQMAGAAGRFSTAFRDFLLEVYDMPVAELDEGELEQIKYLKIEKEGAYLFTYSFEDYYDYDDSASYEETLETVVISVKPDKFDPEDLQYFTGLTKVELYADAWQNYKLPENNRLRSITCKNGESKVGTPQFFSAVNQDTIEEVIILDAKDLDRDLYLEEVKNVKRLSLEYITIEGTDMFAGFDQLEELTLSYPVLEEENICEVVERMLQLPSLKKLTITGSTLWCLDKEEWRYLKKTYGEKVAFERM